MSDADRAQPRHATTANRVDQVCDAFERQFRAGASPQIETHLNETSPQDRPRLLRELVALELDLRFDSEQRPSLDEYVTRFPEIADDMSRLFAELDAGGSTLRGTARRRPTPFSSKESDVSSTLSPSFEGKVIGDFTLLKELGRGGMGTVYQAHQRSLDRMVALKMIRGGNDTSAEERQRFQREARAAAVLDHPGIIPIYNYGEANGQPYFVMAYVEGRSLAARIRERPLEVSESVELMRQIVDAVAYAHEKGVVHRDLKPDNILLTSAGQSRIADFGLALRLEDPRRITGAGQVLGTPAYMAPEQAEGRINAIGPASDVYALGTIYFELLTGEPPFAGESVLSVLNQVLTATPPSLQYLNPAVGADMEAVCLRCLAKAPSERYETARELQRALNRLPPEGSTLLGLRLRERQSRPHARHHVRWNAITTIMGLGTALLIALLVWISLEPGPADQRTTAMGFSGPESPSGATARASSDKPAPLPQQASKTNEPLFVLRGHADHVRAVQFSQDGSRLLSAGEDGTWRLWNMVSGAEVATHDDPSHGLLAACFTSDDRHCLTAGFDGVIRLWDVLEGSIVREFRGHVAKVWDLALVSDGSEFVSVSEDGTVRLWNTATGKLLHTFKESERPVFGVASQPDAPIVASCGADCTIRLWNLKERSLKKTFPPLDGWIWSVAFSRDGLLYSDDGAQVVVWDPETATVRRRFDGHHDWLYCVQPSPCGALLLSGGRDGAMMLRNARTGENRKRFAGHFGDILDLAMTTDCRRFASAGQDATIRVWEAPQ